MSIGPQPTTRWGHHAQALSAAFALIFASLSPAAAQEKRVALIIGNGAYKNTVSLATPVNDAATLPQR